MKLFGREPALVIAVCGSVLTFAAAVGIPGLSAGAAAAITGLITAGIMAATTRPVAPALFTAIVTAGVAVLGEYGLHLSDQVVGAATGLVLTVFALVARGQVSPTSDPARTPVPHP